MTRSIVRFRRPTFLTAALGLLCLAILLGLGFWQLDRREWKQDLLATIDQRLAQPAEALPADPGADWTYRRVMLRGEVASENWFRFPSRAKREGQVGDILMLLVRDASGHLLVAEQAFVPFGGALPPLPATVEREGVLRPPAEAGLFTPDNDAAANQWYTVDPAGMAETAGAGEGPVLPLYAVAAEWRPEIPNNHLEYALTWFSFALIFVIIFGLFHRRRT